MIFVKPYAELLEEENPLIKIERVGRLCYKSSSEYTEETALSFVNRLIKNKHYAMLEHAVFTFKSFIPVFPDLKLGFHELYGINITNIGNVQYISINLRAIIEKRVVPLAMVLVDRYPIFSKLEDDLFKNADSNTNESKAILNSIFLQVNSTLPVSYTEEYSKHHFYTFHIVCDRGVSHEIVRHRKASYAQESTRYCNYSKEGEVAFIEPCWDRNSDEFNMETSVLKESEKAYIYLTKVLKIAPQKARYVLPNALKTELYMTASLKEFKHFINLRYYGTTGSPHPQMKQIAQQISQILGY